MQSSFIRRTLPRSIIALAIMALGVFLSKGDPNITSAAGAFNAATGVALTSTTAGANADTTLSLTFSANDYNFSAIVNATPPGATIAPGPGNPGFVGATHPTLGAVMGSLTTATSLGITNNLCLTPITVKFTFLNATVNNATTNIIDPVPQGSTVSGSRGTLDNQWTDDGASDSGSNPATSPWNLPWGDGAGHGTVAQALSAGERTDKIPAQVQRYPSYLNTLFTPDGGGPVQPLARYAGASNVSDTAIMLNLVLFGDTNTNGVNDLAEAFAPPHPFADLRDVGYVSIAVLNNPEAEAAPGTITDFCTHYPGSPTPYFVTTVLYGEAKTNNCLTGSPRSTCIDTGASDGISKPCLLPPGIPVGFTDCASTGDNPLSGRMRYANPTAVGSHRWINFSQSLRDADADGKENSLDTCATTSDTLDQRVAGAGDTDLDGIADACDVNGTAVADGDGDGWANRGDNCPQHSNSSNAEAERPLTQVAAAPRGGSKTDSMGDLCDPNPSKADGQFLTTLTVVAFCIGGTDGDTDGWCTTALGDVPADPDDGNINKVPEDYSLVMPFAIAHSGSGTAPPMRQPAQVCNDGIDNDGDGKTDNDDGGGATAGIACRPRSLAATDTDGDGWSDEAERAIGTDALGRCEAAGPGNSTDWPGDLAGGTSVDKVALNDVTSFVVPAPKKLNSGPDGAGAPNVFNARWDLTPGNTSNSANWIVLNDITTMTAGAAGTSPAAPPMYVGIGNGKIFNNATACTAHPLYGD